VSFLCGVGVCRWRFLFLVGGVVGLVGCWLGLCVVGCGFGHWCR